MHQHANNLFFSSTCSFLMLSRVFKIAIFSQADVQHFFPAHTHAVTE